MIPSNGVQDDVGSGDEQLNTDQQVTGTAGSQVTVTNSGSTDGECPTAADTTIDWGDDSSDTNAQIQCQEGSEDELDYTLTDTHTYGAAGHYLIQMSYGDLDATTDEYAEISPNGSGVTNTNPPMISGTAEQGQTLTTTNGAWDGSPTSFDYQWQDCDANGQNCADTGTDTDGYVLGAGDVGHTVQVVVTATNDGGQGQATWDTTDRCSAGAERPATRLRTGREPVGAHGCRDDRPDRERHRCRVLGLGDPERPSDAGLLPVRARPEVHGWGRVGVRPVDAGRSRSDRTPPATPFRRR